MKQLVLFLTLSFLLTGCSDNDGSSESTDSTSIDGPVDTTLYTTSPKTEDDESKDYTNSEIINKLETITLVTTQGEMYSDSLLQTPMKKLTLGEHLTIEQYLGTTTKNYWIEPVYKVSYQMGEGLEYGYVSQSQIACRLDTLKSKKIVALTIDYNHLKEKFIGRLSLLDQTGKALSNTSVELDILKEGGAPHSYSYYFSFEEIASTGLDGITESFSIHTGYDACGYPSFDYTFLWNGQKLIAFPETYAIAEAGQFHQYSYWIFPSDFSGKKGSILQIIEGDQYEDVLGNTQTINKDSTVVEFKWNKYSFMSVTGDTILKRSKTYSVEADY